MRSLNCDRHPDLPGKSQCIRRAVESVFTALGEGSANASRGTPRFKLVAERADDVCGRADPIEPGINDCLGKLRAFRQEAIARMHGIRAATLCEADQLLDVKIGVFRAIAAQREGFVSMADE